MRYDQPFCVIGSIGKFKGAKYGYLPALELPEDSIDIETTKDLSLYKTTYCYKYISKETLKSDYF